jgi:hypothetical protein
MSASLTAFGDNQISARLARDCRLFDVLNLTDQLASGRFDRFGVSTRVTEREHQHIGTKAQGQIQHGAAGRPRNQPNAPRQLGFLPHAGQLGSQPGSIPIAATDQTQTARVGNRRRQVTARYGAHGRQDDRMPQAEHFGQCRRNHRAVLLSERLHLY